MPLSNRIPSAATRVGHGGAAGVGSEIEPPEGVTIERIPADATRHLPRSVKPSLREIRCGFRLDLGGSWEPLGVRPDLSAWSKAIANGQALGAVTGIETLREAARSIYVTGSFWYAAVPLAACLATLTNGPS